MGWSQTAGRQECAEPAWAHRPYWASKAAGSAHSNSPSVQKREERQGEKFEIFRFSLASCSRPSQSRGGNERVVGWLSFYGLVWLKNIKEKRCEAYLIWWVCLLDRYLLAPPKQFDTLSPPRMLRDLSRSSVFETSRLVGRQEHDENGGWDFNLFMHSYRSPVVELSCMTD